MYSATHMGSVLPALRRFLRATQARPSTRSLNWLPSKSSVSGSSNFQSSGRCCRQEFTTCRERVDDRSSDRQPTSGLFRREEKRFARCAHSASRRLLEAANQWRDRRRIGRAHGAPQWGGECPSGHGESLWSEDIAACLSSRRPDRDWEPRARRVWVAPVALSRVKTWCLLPEPSRRPLLLNRHPRLQDRTKPQVPERSGTRPSAELRDLR
jgi:hypothetical protein